ncbi:hypothetical protein K1Y78_42340 [Streptomyces sp. tea 10]|nr:hypothetical protein [Streptomyces sp. tea 10]
MLNQDLAACIHNGTVRPRASLVRFHAGRAAFADGTSETVDAVILATGYNVTIPKVAHWDSQDAAIQALVDLIFDPQSDRLFFLGLIQPDGGAWPVFEEQAELVAQYIRASLDRPNVAARFWSGLTADRTSARLRRAGKIEGQLRVDRARYRRHLRLLTTELTR